MAHYEPIKFLESKWRPFHSPSSYRQLLRLTDKEKEAEKGMEYIIQNTLRYETWAHITADTFRFNTSDQCTVSSWQTMYCQLYCGGILER